jgi:hypothetical protein
MAKFSALSFRDMRTATIAVLLCALAACSNVPAASTDNSACAQSESSYACQVERYKNVNS